MDDKVYNQLLHRLDLLEKAHADMEFEQISQEDTTEATKSSLSSEKKFLQSEVKEMKDECNKLHTALLKLGATLKDKVPKRDFSTFEQQVHKWKLEEFILKKDLNPSFDRYAKQ